MSSRVKGWATLMASHIIRGRMPRVRTSNNWWQLPGNKIQKNICKKASVKKSEMSFRRQHPSQQAPPSLNSDIGYTQECRTRASTFKSWILFQVLAGSNALSKGAKLSHYPKVESYPRNLQFFTEIERGMNLLFLTSGQTLLESWI